MARAQIPIAGAYTGSMHGFTSLLTGGRSLHPLQRIGDVGHSGYPSIGAAGQPGFQTAPTAAGPALRYPHILSPSIVTAMNPAARV